ncbi:hypothetical protein V8D89_002345 [Ganoderma adspersum]
MKTFVQEIYGPMFIGVMFNIMLYGIMSTQTYLYFSMYKDDRPWMKAFVLILFLCDTANTGFDIAFMYDPLVNNFGNFDALNTANWMFITEPMMTAIIAALVQTFFAWRVKVLTSNRVVVAIILLCALTQLVGGIGSTITLAIIPHFFNVKKFRILGIIWLVSAALADVLITTALVWHLRKHKTGIAVTDDIVNKIIRLTVQTGLITSLFAVISLVLYLAVPSGYDFIFNMPLAKLYTNSLMSTLNSRRMWKAAASGGSESMGNSGPRTGFNVNVLRGDDSRRNPRVADRIVIGIESHQMTDFANVKDDNYPPNAVSFAPDQKSVSPPETEDELK